MTPEDVIREEVEALNACRAESSALEKAAEAAEAAEAWAKSEIFRLCRTATKTPAREAAIIKLQKTQAAEAIRAARFRRQLAAMIQKIGNKSAYILRLCEYYDIDPGEVGFTD